MRDQHRRFITNINVRDGHRCDGVNYNEYILLASQRMLPWRGRIHCHQLGDILRAGHGGQCG
jgi:hypothetical protein